MRKRLYILLVLTVIFVLFGCTQNNVSSTETPQPTPSVTSTPEVGGSSFEDIEKKTIEVLKNKDMKALSEIVHPEKGVQISPYANISLTHDITIQSNELLNLLDDNTMYNWGSYDGSGFDIELTFSQYYDKFIYTHDFMNAPKKAINEVIGKGNSLNHLFDIYPTDRYKTIEYHFDQVDPANQGIDWASLRLVFELVEDSWKLVAIVHDQWTI